MEDFFAMSRSYFPTILQTIVWAFDSLAMQYLRVLSIHMRKMPLYVPKIYAKCGLLDNTWGFIDSTLHKIGMPTYLQNHTYSGYKKCHVLKFQPTVTPNVLLSYLCTIGFIVMQYYYEIYKYWDEECIINW